MRRAFVEGKFYPESKEQLRKTIDGFFSGLDVSSVREINARAGIAPHAGFVYSGKCAAFLYRQLRNSEFDTFIILGTNHSGVGERIVFSVDDFETSLGSLECDIDIIERLLIKLKYGKFDCGVSEEAHKYEHSIEVQLPFLQVACKSFKIVPVLLRDLSIIEIKKAGKIISDLVREQEKRGKRVFVLASSDLTHYGKSYGFVPFTSSVRDNLYKLDGNIIDKILSLDAEGFYAEARKSTVCGMYSIAVLIEIAKNLNLKSEKLCYYTSGDVLNKWDSAVGYASIGFY